MLAASLHRWFLATLALLAVATFRPDMATPRPAGPPGRGGEDRAARAAWLRGRVDLARDWLEHGDTPTVGGEKPQITVLTDIPGLRAAGDPVLKNIMSAALQYGRVFAIEYDITGANAANGELTYIGISGDGVDHARNEVVVRPAAEEADRVAGSLVLRQQAVNMCLQLHLRHPGRDVQRPLQPKFRRDLGEQVFDGRNPDRGQHRLLVFGRVENVHGNPLRRDLRNTKHALRTWSFRAVAFPNSRRALSALRTRVAGRTAPR